MADQKSPTTTKGVHLRWTGSGMDFVGRGEKGGEVVMDGSSVRGPGPMEALLLAVAGCMAIDVLSILERSRVPLDGMEVKVEGERAPDHPKRYTSLHLAFLLQGPEKEHQARVERAVALSRDKFCSVLHSLRGDIEVGIDIRRV